MKLTENETSNIQLINATPSVIQIVEFSKQSQFIFLPNYGFVSNQLFYRTSHLVLVLLEKVSDFKIQSTHDANINASLYYL